MNIFTRIICATVLSLAAIGVSLLALFEVKRRKNTTSDNNDVKKLVPKPALSGFWGKTVQTVVELSLIEKIVFVLVAGIIWFATYRVLGFKYEMVFIARVLLAYGFLLFAAIVDFYTKKIPNLVPATMSALSVIVFLIEIIWFRTLFKISLVSCLAASVICFLFFLLVALIARGGFGMGDVKLISSMTFLSGIASSIYSTVIGLIICMIVSIVLLVMKKKNIRDELPFGPFIFIGYIITLILGKF